MYNHDISHQNVNLVNQTVIMKFKTIEKYFVPKETCQIQIHVPWIRLSANTMTQLFCRTFDEAGFTAATIHSGRSTFITNLANKSNQHTVISKLTRHSDVSVKSRFISVNDEQLRAAV
jgi:hypothetical protein